MLIFKNCLISTGFQNETKNADILVADGKIVHIDDHIAADAPVIEIDGRLLVPGAIDPHVHFNDPGFTHREDFYHGTASAAKGGVTTIIDMPCTSLPPVTTVPNLLTKISAIQHQANVDYALWGGVCGYEFDEKQCEFHMKSLTDAGVVGFKTYSISGMNSFPALTPEQMSVILNISQKLDIVVGHHAEDPDIVNSLTRQFEQAGRTDPEAYWLSRPSKAEIVACDRISRLAEEAGATLHIVHVASAEAVTVIRPSCTTLETCPHYLAFSMEDFLEKKGFLKTAPVVKTREDSAKLWEYLAKGKIQFVATDHAPCTLAEKNTGSIWTDYGGVPGTELMLNYIYSEGFRKNRLTLARLIEVTSTNAAMRFGLYPRKGALNPGADADFAIIDPSIEWTVTSQLMSKAQFTPFEGWIFKGKVIRTYLRGMQIYDPESGLNDPPEGRWIKRTSL